jgi:hypothetical protein
MIHGQQNVKSVLSWLRYCEPKTAGVVPAEGGRLTPETCRRLRQNKVFVKVKVY